MQPLVELLLKNLSMITLILAGLFFIYEGSYYIAMKRDNPQRIPDKMYAAGYFTMILGIVSIIFGALHFFIKWRKKYVRQK